MDALVLVDAQEHSIHIVYAAPVNALSGPQTTTNVSGFHSARTDHESDSLQGLSHTLSCTYLIITNMFEIHSAMNSNHCATHVLPFYVSL